MTVRDLMKELADCEPEWELDSDVASDTRSCANALQGSRFPGMISSVGAASAEGTRGDMDTASSEKSPESAVDEPRTQEHICASLGKQHESAHSIARNGFRERVTPLCRTIRPRVKPEEGGKPCSPRNAAINEK